jgi:hypothetical protein
VEVANGSIRDLCRNQRQPIVNSGTGADVRSASVKVFGHGAISVLSPLTGLKRKSAYGPPGQLLKATARLLRESGIPKGPEIEVPRFPRRLPLVAPDGRMIPLKASQTALGGPWVYFGRFRVPNSGPKSKAYGWPLAGAPYSNTVTPSFGGAPFRFMAPDTSHCAGRVQQITAQRPAALLRERGWQDDLGHECCPADFIPLGGRDRAHNAYKR